MEGIEPVHVYIPGRAGDPRLDADLPEWVVPHFGPPLHPDDVTTVRGIPTTTVERTLIDLAEMLDPDELRECFVNAVSGGLLDGDEFQAARARVEWRPSLATLDKVAAEFL